MKNKKLLVWLGLLLTSSIIIPFQVNATDFWTISIANPENPEEWFTIMDRNLWATSNNITSTDSYWYKYQRWNNYWFINWCFTDKSRGCSDSITNSAKGVGDKEQYQYRNWFTWDNEYNNKWYYESTFYKVNSSPRYHRGEWNYHDWLWWWLNDNPDNNWWDKQNNSKDRQWPCPDGYHIPSDGEWWLLVKYWKNTYWTDITNYGDNYFYDDSANFREYFKLPYAGYRGYGDAILYQQWTRGKYRSSSPYATPEEYEYWDSQEWLSSDISEYARYFWIDINFVWNGGYDNRHNWFPIRCFKNTYEPEFSIDTIKCEPMKNPNIYHTIKNDTITLGWDDIKWDNMEISIYDPVNDIYKSLGTAKMSDKNFTYKIKWDLEQNFKFSNGCSEYYYKVTTKCDWMKYASISHTVKNDTITFNWNAIEWDTVEISIFDPIKETYKKIGTTKMNNEEFSYKIKWEWEQNFKFSNGCDNYYYKVNVSLNDKDSAKLDWNLVNNIKKTVEFKSYEVSKKIVFSGIYTALNDTTINYYWIETKYDESKGNNYINERCKKNTTDMTFYVYIDWKMIDRTPQTNSCSLAQGAWFGKRIDEITLKKWETKSIKVEIEMSWSVKEEDIYNFKLSLNNVDKNSRNFDKWKVKADFNIKILNNDKDSVNSNTENEKNQNNKGITTVKKSDWDPSDILSNWYTRELNDAYQFAHENWITTTKNIGKAKMNSPLTRIAMAKMLSNYAINILWKQPDTSKWIIKFNDVTNKQNSDYGNAVTLAYQLWIMWQNMKNNNFRPNDEVTRAEFATALSRMLYNTEDWKWNAKYYDPHIAKLYDEWIITYTNPKTEEKRWYVMIMLMRTAE